MQMALVMGRGQIREIVDAVRNRVLEWSGIVGDGVSFSHREKAVAKQGGDTYNIGNFSGVMGNVGAHATVKTEQVVTYGAEDLRKLVEQIKAHAGGLDLTPAGRAELDGAMSSLMASFQRWNPIAGS